MTWRDVKLATLQKMFSAEGLTINENDETIREYVNAMSQVANEALQMLCTAGKYMRKDIAFDSGGIYDLTALLDDFYSVGEFECYVMSEKDMVRLEGAALIGGKFLKIPEGFKGQAIFFYNAWPKQITQTTPDSQILEVDPEVAVLLPLYMASQLYKDDDIAISTQYRNEFEVAFERLQQSPSGSMGEEFTGLSGWV